MRSAAFANKPGQRSETFCSRSTVLGIVLAFLLLLFLLYPERSLLEMLDRSQVSPAGLRYRESLLRQNPGDLSQRLRLVEDLLVAGQFQRGVELLDGMQAPTLTIQQRAQGLELRCRALQGLLLSLAAEDPGRAEVARDFAATILRLIAIDPTPERARGLAQAAQEVGDHTSAAHLQQLFETAEEALARRDYRKSSELFFQAMHQAQSLSARREQFQKAVAALQAGDLIVEALARGEAQLGVLGADRPSLLFLSRIALAANRPDKAEVFIKKALGLGSKSASERGG